MAPGYRSAHRGRSGVHGAAARSGARAHGPCRGPGHDRSDGRTGIGARPENEEAGHPIRMTRFFSVELRRIELLTSCMPCRRSTN